MDEIQQESSFPLSLNHIIWAIRRRKGAILACALFGLAAAQLFITFVPPKYAASAQLIFDGVTEELVNTEHESRVRLSGQHVFGSAVALIGSPGVLKPVALKIMSQPEQNLPAETAIQKIVAKTDLTAGERVTALLKILEKGLAVTTPAADQVVVVEYRSSSPSEAAYVANLIAATFLEQRAESRKASLAQAAAWLDERAVEAKNRLMAVDKKIQEFKAAHRIETERGSSALEAELTQERNQLSAVQTRLAEARTVYETLHAYVSENASDYEKLAESIGGATLERLRSSLADAEGALASAKARFGAYHPDVQARKSQVAAIRAEIAAEARRKQLTSKMEMEQLTSREQVLQEAVKNLESQVRDLRGSEVQLLELQRERDAARTLYDATLARLMQANVQQTLNFGQFKILLDATLPRNPKWPAWLFWAGGTFFGLGFGVFISVALEIYQDKVVMSDDVKKRLPVNIISQVPLISETDVEGKDAIGAQSCGNFAEKFPNSLFSNKLFSVQAAVKALASDVNCKIIMVTSPLAGNGKTYLASNLASLSKFICKKTLLVDFDSRKHGIEDGSVDEAQCADLRSFLKNYQLENVFRATHRTGVGDYDVLQVRPSSETACLRFFQTQAEEFLKCVRQHYDHVWIDTPPALIFSDPLIIAGQVDGVLIVAEWSETTIKQLKDTINLVQESDGHVLGVIINKVRVDRLISASMASYGDYYGDRKQAGHSLKL